MSHSGEEPKAAGEKCLPDELRTLFLFEALTDAQLETLCQQRPHRHLRAWAGLYRG